MHGWGQGSVSNLLIRYGPEHITHYLVNNSLKSDFKEVEGSLNPISICLLYSKACTKAGWDTAITPFANMRREHQAAMGAAALTAPRLWPEEAPGSPQLPPMSGSKTRPSSGHGWGDSDATWRVPACRPHLVPDATGAAISIRHVPSALLHCRWPVSPLLSAA